MRTQPGAIVADGMALKLYGEKELRFRTFDAQSLTIRFYVSDVSRSILSCQGVSLRVLGVSSVNSLTSYQPLCQI
eukprot:13273129-Heterocapsa_arctica.AAC.1